MIGISKEIIDDFCNHLFNTTPFQQLDQLNADGFREIISDTLNFLYKENPKDIINFMEKNASERFLDLLYREAGINDYHIRRIPENLKTRISYLLNVLNTSRATQKVFSLFHEALEEFYPKMNIYLIEVQSKKLDETRSEFVYRLDPRYITDPDNIIEEVTVNELSGTFLMRPEQFIDREEKFSNIYQDYKSKKRTINIFPIKTGILYIQNPTGLGHAHFDTYIPLMQMIGASLQQYNMIPWKTNQSSPRRNVPFVDFIKLCTYLKFKEFEFKAKKLDSRVWEWKTQPLETYRDKDNLTKWNNALIQSYENGVPWSHYYEHTRTKLNDFLLNAEDLAEAERLETVYRGLKRSGRYNSREELNKFKTDWNTLRQKPRNVSLRKVSNMKEFREELIGTEPLNLLELELLLLMNFKKSIHGTVRDHIVQIKKIYTTNKENTLDPENGLITLLQKFHQSVEFSEFVFETYNKIEYVATNETKFLMDLLNYYIKKGTTPILKNYNFVKKLKFPELLDIEIDDTRYLNKSIYQRVKTELLNNTNIVHFTELNEIIKIKYRGIIEEIDEMLISETTEVEDFTLMFLYLWKLIQADLPQDQRVRYFWNEFFMRMIMGSTFKDFFFDPIIDLFLEYWFPAETTTQNKDIQTLLIKDKMQSIPLDSKWYLKHEKEVNDTLVFKDQNILTVFDKDQNIKTIYKNTFKELPEKEIEVIIKG